MGEADCTCTCVVIWGGIAATDLIIIGSGCEISGQCNIIRFWFSLELRQLLSVRLRRVIVIR